MIRRLLAVAALGASGLFAQGFIGISPAFVAAGTPDFNMVINGTGFCSGSYGVYVQGGAQTVLATPLNSQFINSGQLIATVPANLVDRQQTATVYVDNHLCTIENTRSIGFTVGPAIALLPDTILTANVGSPYSTQFQGVNGNVPYTWALLATLEGFTFDTINGILTGTPTRIGDFPFTVQVRDRFGAFTTRNYILHVEAALLDITSLKLPNGLVGTPYDQSLKASGGVPPYQFFFQQGSLPPGLSFKSDNSGAITGTPTVAGTYSFVANVRDSNGQTASRNISLTIDATRQVISPDTIPSGTVSVFYTQTFTVTGGTAPYSWSILSLDVEGFRIDPSTGVFTGTTTAAGTYTLNVQVTDKSGTSVQKRYSLVISSGLSITTASLPDGVVGTTYPTTTLQAAGAQGPYTWGVLSGTLPDGLFLDASSGQITGTPTKAGTFDLTIRVAIATGASAQKAFRIAITQPIPPLLITTASLKDGVVGSSYTDAVAATGGTTPYTYSSTALPGGLSLDPKTGAITGTPTTAGTTSITFTVTDAAQKTATQSLSIRIIGVLSIATSAVLPGGTVGVAYTQTFAATGGLTPYKWSAAGLPTGFAIDANTGALTGTPTSTAALSFTVTVTDSRGTAANRAFTATVVLPALPPATIGGLPANSPPARQPVLTLTIGDVFPVDVTGTLTLTFASAVGGSDDTVQFTSGGRSATFRIPAGSKTATFNSATVGVVTGTVAGTITITASLNAAGADVTPSPAPVQRIVVDQLAPVLTKVVLNPTSTGYDVLVTGYSTTRSMVRGTFTFAPTSNANLQTTSLQVALDAAFLTWFNSAASNATGGQFTLTMPFVTSGPTGAVSSVTVVLTNARGDSNSLSPQ